jgi:multimeric flavodoxin WrbA
MEAIRIVGLSGSPRRANTERIVEIALESAKEAVIKLAPGVSVVTELVSLANKKIAGCNDCRACLRTGSLCVRKDDWLEVMSHLINPEPNGLIIGAPVYFFGTNSLLRAFLERATCLFKKNWHSEFPFNPPDWSKTAAGALAVGAHRNGGQEHALNNIIDWLLITGFTVVGSYNLQHGPIGYIGGSCWTGLQRTPDELPVDGDDWGKLAVQTVGANVGKTALRLALGEEVLGKM